jgi:pimeloyl-ACP methyl ester carboxylesterase
VSASAGGPFGPVRQNCAPHPEPAAYAARFTGKYAHRTLTGGIGHNLPQEAPLEFVRAIKEADLLAS